MQSFSSRYVKNQGVIEFAISQTLGSLDACAQSLQVLQNLHSLIDHQTSEVAMIKTELALSQGLIETTLRSQESALSAMLAECTEWQDKHKAALATVQSAEYPQQCIEEARTRLEVPLAFPVLPVIQALSLVPHLNLRESWSALQSDVRSLADTEVFV